MNADRMIKKNQWNDGKKKKREANLASQPFVDDSVDLWQYSE